LKSRLVTPAATAAGLVLFVYAVREAGPADIASGIRRVGWGLLPVLLIGGLRFVLRAESWRLCMPPGVRMPAGRSFSAFLAGDAVGNVTPLGPVASEPAKIFLTRHRLATAEAVASLAIDNTIYAASVMAMIAIGAVVMLTAIPLPFEWQEAAVVTLVALVAGAALGWRLMQGFWTGAPGARPLWRERLAWLRESVRQFSAGQRKRVARVFGLHMTFHALTVVETYLTLGWLLGDGLPSVSQAIAFAALNRAVQVAFKFVPLLVGVDEAASGAFAPLLGVDPATAVSLAVVRKIRVLFWTGVGLLLTAAHPAPAARPARDRRGSEPAHRI
jgi:hypothetical protein